MSYGIALVRMAVTRLIKNHAIKRPTAPICMQRNRAKTNFPSLIRCPIPAPFGARRCRDSTPLGAMKLLEGRFLIYDRF